MPVGRVENQRVLQAEKGIDRTQAELAFVHEWGLLCRIFGPAESSERSLQTDIRLGTGICVHYPEDGSRGNTAASLVADLCQDGSRLPVY